MRVFEVAITALLRKKNQKYVKSVEPVLGSAKPTLRVARVTISCVIIVELNTWMISPICLYRD